MAVNQLHQPVQDGHRHNGDPRTGDELRDEDDDEDRRRHDQPDRVDDARERRIRPRAAGSDSTLSNRVQCRTIPAWLSERHEHADDVQLDQCGDLGLEDQDEHDRGQRQEHDSVGEGQAVAAGVQLARQVAVLRKHRAEDREPVESGVGGQHQDEGRSDRHHVERRRESAEDGVGELGDHRTLPVALGSAGQLGRPDWRRT